MSVLLHLVLFLVVVAGSDVLADSARRVIRITGQDYDREDYEVTELVLPPELTPPATQPVPAPAPEAAPVPPPPDAVVIPAPEPPPPPEPEPENEAQAAPPPPPPEPEPQPPPPIIGRDDVIAEGARPDASPDAPEPDDAERGEAPPRVTLDEPAGPAGEDGEDGEDGDSPEDGGDAPETVEAIEGTAESEASPESPGEAVGEGLLLPNLRDRARELAAESEERSRRDAAIGRRAGTSGSEDAVPDFSTEEPTILSDTRGYDFGPYMNQVVNRVRVNWYSLIPEAARLRQVRGRVVVMFTITKNGNVENARIAATSDHQPLDNAAIGSIMASNPFPRIPDDFDGENLVLQFTFLYNMQ